MCNGNFVLNEKKQNDVWDYNSCQQKCKETNNCNYFGVWTAGRPCIGWDKCDSCQASAHENEIYELESGNKNVDTDKPISF